MPMTAFRPTALFILKPFFLKIAAGIVYPSGIQRNQWIEALCTLFPQGEKH